MFRTLLLAAAAIAPLQSGHASTITQFLSAKQDMAEQGPFSIMGKRFDPTLGQLDSVDATLTGFLSERVGPYQSGPLNRFTGTIRYNLNGFGLGNSFSGPLESIDLFYNGYDVTSTASRFTVSVSFPDFRNFISVDQTPLPLVDFSVYASFSNPDLYGPPGGDFSSATGTLALTYTYNVPEPLSAALLGTAALLAAGIRRRMRTSP